MCNEKKFCDKKCLKCKYHVIVPDPDPDDWFNDDDMAMYCTNPDNNMEKEWTSPSQRERILSYISDKPYLKKGWTFICGSMRPYELGKSKEDNIFANKESDVLL